jgi:uncharacterized membrane protein (UPF0127 family)
MEERQAGVVKTLNFKMRGMLFVFPYNHVFFMKHVECIYEIL